MSDEDAAAAPALRWGLGEAVMAFVVGTVLSAVAGGIAQSAINAHPAKGSPVPLAVTIASLVGLWAGLGGGTLYSTRARGTGSLSADFGLGIRRWDIGVGIVVGLVSQYGLVRLIYLPFEQFDHGLAHRLENQAKDLTRSVHGGPQITLLFLFLAVGAPFFEELFFRGLLLRSLDRRFGAPVAVVISSALFGLAHFELLQLPALVMFGVVLAILAERTGRLGPGIAAHAAFNAATVLTLTLGKR